MPLRAGGPGYCSCSGRWAAAVSVGAYRKCERRGHDFKETDPGEKERRKAQAEESDDSGPGREGEGFRGQGRRIHHQLERSRRNVLILKRIQSPQDRKMRERGDRSWFRR